MKISSQLLNQVNYLHTHVGNKEWSGPLIYKIIQGDINDPNNLVIEATRMFLMDIGTSGSTDFEMSEEDTVELYSKHEELMEDGYRIGLIHSHHSMRVYFSGTDIDELKENVDNYNVYLSLIVGTKHDPVAKLAFLSEVEDDINRTFSFKNIANKLMKESVSEKTTKKMIMWYDCDIQVPQVVSDYFKERYDEVDSSRTYGVYPTGYGGAYPYNGQRKKKTTPAKQTQFNFSDDSVEQFLCKIVTANPASNARNLWSVLNSLHKGFKKSQKDIINSIDEAMIRTLGKANYDKMTLSQRLEFLSEAVEYLEVSDTKNEPLSEKYESAKAASDALISILITNDENEEEEDEEIIGFQG